ncbi:MULTISPECIES: fluoride efflux transporter CrcB [Devosia]|uniref:Fluoride-specific ion channel FluC n=1 Tax=Devosia equisanguinis TaxID=2490941 RepID=A0A3S4D897_9HYPH|nr:MULTISPECIES: fluoride efflux transporter CrcB [Devosia]ODT50324.1 MAG: camphor resistance protein CrcB [Pelagibacterium sp. SCN 63-126]ODU86488.1 MAG: camphor resistance protein CrcB [Pelagibacterium sp. SCN 63-17]OJX45068.1 MAG: camphor resistance protein CrcB [Devosia sp. 63-57]VDS06730.1 Putative fluoride ion transporter CrcB [Devosia equisanguinis]
MMAFALVGIGGAIGAMGRYGLSQLIGRLLPMSFPLATLLVNILGSLAMGVFVGLMARLLPAWQAEARLFVAVGILGGFTTFSSFSLDTIVLMERGALIEAGLYVVLSVVVCLAGLYLGLLMTRGGPA